MADLGLFKLNPEARRETGDAAKGKGGGNSKGAGMVAERGSHAPGSDGSRGTTPATERPSGRQP